MYGGPPPPGFPPHQQMGMGMGGMGGMHPPPPGFGPPPPGFGGAAQLPQLPPPPRAVRRELKERKK